MYGTEEEPPYDRVATKYLDKDDIPVKHDIHEPSPTSGSEEISSEMEITLTGKVCWCTVLDNANVITEASSIKKKGICYNLGLDWLAVSQDLTLDLGFAWIWILCLDYTSAERRKTAGKNKHILFFLNKEPQT